MKRRYEVGLEKLQFASSQVNRKLRHPYVVWFNFVISIVKSLLKSQFFVVLGG